MRSEIRAFLASKRGAKLLTGISDSDSLLETGVIDSVAMVDLIAHIQKAYGVSVNEDEMTPENFDSLDAIAHYVQGKLASGSGKR